MTLPQPWLDYLALCRVSNLPTVWTNALSAAVLSGGAVPSAPFFAALVSVTALYSAGVCLNDLWDVGTDRVLRPGRPLPAGRVSYDAAMRLALGLFAAGLAPLFLLPRSALAAGALLTALILLYDRFHRGCSWTVWVMGGCRFLVFAVTSLAVCGSLRFYPLLAGAVQLLYVVALSAVARWETRKSLPFPVVPAMIGGISLVDGALLSVFAGPSWIWAGVAGACLTWLGNRWVRGD